MIISEAGPYPHIAILFASANYHLFTNSYFLPKDTGNLTFESGTGCALTNSYNSKKMNLSPNQ
jgi:hypothetical protein